MRAHKQDVLIPIEDIVGAVAMVHIKIEYHHLQHTYPVRSRAPLMMPSNWSTAYQVEFWQLDG